MIATKWNSQGQVKVVRKKNYGPLFVWGHLGIQKFFLEFRFSHFLQAQTSQFWVFCLPWLCENKKPFWIIGMWRFVDLVYKNRLHEILNESMKLAIASFTFKKRKHMDLFCSSVHLSVCLSVCLSPTVSVCVCLSVFN